MKLNKTILGFLFWGKKKDLKQDNNESWTKEWAQETKWKTANKFDMQDMQQMEVKAKKSLEGWK